MDAAKVGLDAVFLDDLPLPQAKLWGGQGAEKCLRGLGLSGPFASNEPLGTTALTLHFEGLQLQAWPDVTASTDGQIPDEIRAQIWPESRSEVFFLCDAARFADRGGESALSELDAVCLFTGETEERLGDVATYLVRLPSDHPFARRLFRNDGRHWSYWPLGAGIFLQSDASMDQIHKQFRRFTKLSDGVSWKFLRLAEPRTLLPLLLGLSAGLRGRMFHGITQMIAIDPDEEILLKFRCSDPAEQVVARIEPRLKATLDASVRARFGRAALQFCRETITDRPAPEGLDEARFGGLALRQAQMIGLYDRQAVLLAAAAAWCANSADSSWLRRQDDLTARPELSQLERARALLRRAYASAA